VTVVDDFAHNPAKIRAAIGAARGLGRRIFAVYQPHGFGPTRFLRTEYVETFREVLGAGDTLLLLPIYYAGGTAVKDVSSADLVSDLGAVPFAARAVADREEVVRTIRAGARREDCVIVMGARDPSLPGLAADLVAALTPTGAEPA
jgi:UDP-N-acetylmuramate--alanine ligase